MAKLRRSGEEVLKLTLRGDRITVEAFADAVTAFLEVVREVTAEMTGSAKEIEWLVAVESGSAQVSFIAERSKPTTPVRQVTAAVYGGMKELDQHPTERRPIKRPKHFTDHAVQRAKEISQLAERKRVESIRVRRSREHNAITRETALNASRILEARPTEVGSIEGQLQMLSVRHRMHFAIWDDLHDREVRCYIPASNEALYDQAHAAMRQRVAVFGVVRLTEAGEPTSIQVKDIEVFPDPSELPTADEIYGILSEGGE